MRTGTISENLDVEKFGDTVRLKYQPPDQWGSKDIDLTLLEVSRLRDWLDKELGRGKP